MAPSVGALCLPSPDELATSGEVVDGGSMINRIILNTVEFLDRTKRELEASLGGGGATRVT